MTKRKKLTEKEELKRLSSKEMIVAKSNQMIQRGRVKLSLQEQRCVLYAISKIKPDDDVFKEYTFDINELYSLCGIKDQSYTRLKNVLIGLKQKCWWVETDEEGTLSAVSWFNKVRTNKKSGKVTIRFDDDMMPYLLNLSSQAEDQGFFFTQYGVKYVLPMQTQYGPRLYEILKSYQINNRRWFFEVEELKWLLSCENYRRWPDFKRRILEPAIDEINKFSDLAVSYEVETKGRKVTRVIFFMAKKKPEALIQAEREGLNKMEGVLDLDAIIDEWRAKQENPL